MQMFMLCLGLAAMLLVQREMPVVRLAGAPGSDVRQTPAQPSQPPPTQPASPSQPLPPRPVTQVDAAAEFDAPRHLTLTFLEPRPIDEVLHLLVTGTPFSLAIDSDVS